MITIDDIKTANKVRHHHFFDPETIRFFNSRTLPEVYSGPGGIFFVTSERVDTGPRFYKVRHFYPDTGGITTCGIDLAARLGLDTKAEAVAAATAAAAGD